MFSTMNGGHDNFAKITRIDFNGCINTSKVTSMARMFYGCQALNSLDLSSFNTANVENMMNMFHYCQALKSLDLSSFNTANVTNMSYMFYYCWALESLDIRNFDMGKVINSNSMFLYIGYKASNRTSIMVTTALKSVLENKNVSAGDYAYYVAVDDMPR